MCANTRYRSCSSALKFVLSRGKLVAVFLTLSGNESEDRRLGHSLL